MKRPQESKDDEPLPVVAMCGGCRQGFVMHRLIAPCFRCGGSVQSISPIPNEWPHVDGHYVRQLADGRNPS